MIRLEVKKIKRSVIWNRKYIYFFLELLSVTNKPHENKIEFSMFPPKLLEKKTDFGLRTLKPKKSSSYRYYPFSTFKLVRKKKLSPSHKLLHLINQPEHQAGAMEN